MAHEQDGHPRRAHDTFGIAAHDQSGDAAAAVGPEHDQVGAALFRLFDDYVGDRMTDRFAEHGLAGDPVPESWLGQLVYPFAEIARELRGRRAQRPEPLVPPASPAE